MKTFITNTSQHPDNAVRWLVKFAADEVYQVAQREGWADRFDNTPTLVRVTNTRHSYCGRYLGRYMAHAINGFNRRLSHFGVAPKDYVRNILCRIGSAAKFPRPCTYPRYQDMPEMTVADWQEGLVMLAAHELAHTRYSGGKEGEFNCELVAADAIDAFRKARHEFVAYVTSCEQKAQEHEVALAAKRSPEAVAITKLLAATTALAKWQRKLKLATTKHKHYTRLVKRLQAKATTAPTP